MTIIEENNMTTHDLEKSAVLLRQPSPETAAEYAEKRDRLAARINEIMAARLDTAELVGADNLEMMRDNHRNHARFMETVFHAYSPGVLVRTVLWVYRAYRAHGFSLAYWPAQLDTWVEILRAELSPPAFAEIYPFYQWMLVNQPAFVELSDQALAGPLPSHG
jgi:hypothetical protein